MAWAEDFSKGFSLGNTMRSNRISEEKERAYADFRERQFKAMQEHQKFAEDLALREEGRKKRAEDNGIMLQLHNISTNEGLNDKQKVFFINDLARQQGQDPNSPRFKDFKDMVVSLSGDQGRALTNTLQEVYKTSEPGSISKLVTTAMQGGITRTQIFEMVKESEAKRQAKATQDAAASVYGGQDPSAQSPQPSMMQSAPTSAPASQPQTQPQPPQGGDYGGGGDSGQFDATMFADDIAGTDMPGTNLGSSPSASPGMEGQLGQMQGVLDQASGESDPSSPGAMRLGMNTPIPRNMPLSRNAPIQMPSLGGGAPAGAGTPESPFQITQDAQGQAPASASMAPSAPTAAPSAAMRSSAPASAAAKPVTAADHLDLADKFDKMGPQFSVYAEHERAQAKAVDESSKVAGEVSKAKTEAEGKAFDAADGAKFFADTLSGAVNDFKDVRKMIQANPESVGGQSPAVLMQAYMEAQRNPAGSGDVLSQLASRLFDPAGRMLIPQSAWNVVSALDAAKAKLGTLNYGQVRKLFTAGQLTEGEWKIFQNLTTSLNVAQEPKLLVRNLNYAERVMEKYKGNVLSSYKERYGKELDWQETPTDEWQAEPSRPAPTTTRGSDDRWKDAYPPQ